MIGFPFDSQVTYEADGTPVFDRAVSSAPLRQLIKSMLSNGVLPNPSTNLQVQPGTGMNVIVNPGFAVIEGGLKYEENQRTLAVQASDTTYDRIDSVVLRWNDNTNARICDFYVLEGTPASSPVRPTLNRESAVYEIGLADLFIPANSSAISVARITDTRYEAERCGIISSITEFDSDTIYKQIQADLAEFKEEEQADFTAWFEYIKEQLSEDAAGNLQAQIGAMSELETDEKSDLVKAINEVNEKAKNGGKNLVGDEFSEEVAYSTGDYCIYNNVLKKFIADKDAGAWDDSVVEDTTVADELSEQNKNLEAQASNLESKIFQYRLLLASNLTIASTDETIVPLSNYWSSEADFQLNDDGTITYLGENPAYIMISASLYFYTGVINARKQVRLYRNRSVISTGNTYVNSQYTSLIVPTAVFDLKNGDTLKLCYTGSVNDVIGSNSNLTQLSLIGYTSEYLANK